MNPLEKVEALYEELVAHYGDGEDRELRAAAKFLLVGLGKFREHGGERGIQLVDEYVALLKRDPEKLDRILKTQLGRGSAGSLLA
jgi:hypothetical protein